MSRSTFHNSFRAVTETSPLQYIKNVRLHKARTLMIQDGLNANIAAMQVDTKALLSLTEIQTLVRRNAGKRRNSLREQQTVDP